MECKLHGYKKETKLKDRKKWKLRDAGLENFQVDFSDRLHNEDKVNERLVENVKGAAVHCIGYIMMSGRE